jgi:branched-chain amino acid transport system substrate-binding protein
MVPRQAAMIRALLLLSVFALLNPARAFAADDIKIGYTPFLTGVRANLGAREQKAILLAAKQINAAGGVNGKRLTLVIADNQSTTEGAVAALKKVVEEGRVLAVVGFILSPHVIASSDAIESYAVPTMIGGTNVTLTRRGNPWLFRVRPDDSIAALAMLKFVEEDLKLRKVGILHDVDAFGVGGADLLQRGAQEHGLTVVGRQEHHSGDTDYRAQLEALRSAGAEVLLTYNHEGDAGWIQRQYRELGSPFAYLGSPGSQIKSTLDISKEAAEGLLAVADFVPGQSVANQRYAHAYREEYKEEYDATASWAYDALNILAAAIRIAGEDRNKIREAILALKDYQGVLGTFNFSPNGDGLHEVSIVRIENGRPTLIKSVRVDPK